MATRKQRVPPATLPPLSDKLERLDVKQLLTTEPPDVPWVVEPIAARGAVTLLVGREGQGKSMITQAIADAVAAGEHVAGMNVPEAARVLVVDAENGEAEIHRRVRALGRGGGFGMNLDGPANLEVLVTKDLDLSTDMDTLDLYVKMIKPKLLILDSLRSLHSGSEYSRKIVPMLRAFQDMARRYDVAVIVLHHSPKTSDKTFEYRGSTMIGAVVELSYYLGSERGDSDPARRFLHCTKSRIAAAPERMWLRIACEGEGVAIDVAPAPTAEEAANPRPVRDRLLREVLWTLAFHGSPMNRSEIGRELGRDPKDRSVGRVLEQLLEEQMVTRDKDWRYSILEPAEEPPAEPPATEEVTS